MKNLIQTQSDIIKLLDEFDYFHDSCLVLSKFTSGSFVDESKAMHFGNNNITLLFHSQSNSKKLKLTFLDILEIHLLPVKDAMSDCYINLTDNGIVFVDSECFSTDKINCSYIYAKQMIWQFIE